MNKFKTIAKYFLKGKFDTFGYFHGSELKRALTDGTLQPHNYKRVLEIGTYEAIFACYAAEHFAETVDTVDPFLTTDPGTRVLAVTERHCLFNIANCKAINRIRLHKTTSDAFFAANDRQFDFIYVDGSHEPEDAYRDLSHSLRACARGGVIWIDDYGSTYPGLQARIEDWLRDHAVHIQVFHKGYQVGLTKHAQL